jgi:hypothetical protein
VGGLSIFPPTQDVTPGVGRRVVGEEALCGHVVSPLPLNRLFILGLPLGIMGQARIMAAHALKSRPVPVGPPIRATMLLTQGGRCPGVWGRRPHGLRPVPDLALRWQRHSYAAVLRSTRMPARICRIAASSGEKPRSKNGLPEEL